MIEWINSNNGFASAALSIVTITLSIIAVCISVHADRKRTNIELFEKREKVFTLINKITTSFQHSISEHFNNEYIFMFATLYEKMLGIPLASNEMEAELETRLYWKHAMILDELKRGHYLFSDNDGLILKFIEKYDNLFIVAQVSYITGVDANAEKQNKDLKRAISEFSAFLKKFLDSDFYGFMERQITFR